MFQKTSIKSFFCITYMLDLSNNQYDMETLRKNIYAISLIDIILYQKIDEEFAVQFILNPDYQLTPEESNIQLSHVLYYQKHLDPLKIELLGKQKSRRDIVFDEYI